METGRPTIPKGIAEDAGGLRASQHPADPVAAASHIINALAQGGSHHNGETGSLREELIGAWELVSYVVHPVAAGGEDLYPFGDTPQDLIMYTPDGFMSARLMRPGRPEFASWFDAAAEELRAAASGYIGTAGRSTWTRRAPSPAGVGLLAPELDRAVPAPSGGASGRHPGALDGRSDPVTGQGHLRLLHLAPRKNPDAVITSTLPLVMRHGVARAGAVRRDGRTRALIRRRPAGRAPGGAAESPPAP